MSPTRRELLGAGAALAGGVLAAPAAAGAASKATAPRHLSDAGWLGRLAEVKRLSEYLYARILATGAAGAAAHDALAGVHAQEVAHLEALRAAGVSMPPGPGSDRAANERLAGRNLRGRLGQFKSPRDATYLLLAVERVTIGVCFVALRDLRGPGPTTLVARIMASDAQHEAQCGLLLNPGDVRDSIPYGLIQGVQ